MAAGVSAGTGAMSSLLGKLSDLLGREYRLLTRVRKEVLFLQRELGSMHALLETLADMGKLDPLAKDWKGKIRDLTYDLEDCIDRFIDRIDDGGGAKRGFMKKTARRLRTLWERHDIATQIKELKDRVVEESARRDRYKIDESCKARIVEIDPRLATFHEEVKGLVAIDSPMKQVISWLMDEKAELKVVAIVGSGGLGKTTLAMEVYRKIRESFQCRASVSVSRTLNLDKLLKDVLSQINEKEHEKCRSEQWEKEQLIRKLRQILTRKRYLVVIDDVWREQDWKFVKAAFPEINNGSRIIVTTRNKSVANSCCSNSSDQTYQMAPLKEVDSQRLFFKRIFRSDCSCPPHLEKVSARILKKCGGVPLAIITMASLLANKPENVDEWERLQDYIGIGSSLENDGNLKAMKDILLLSYWDLPRDLKTCLLYLCIYPEDDFIWCEELKYKWISEGFIATKCENLDQTAENYLIELVNRSLIEPVDVDYDGSIKCCRVHDIVLDLIISLSEEENFAAILNGRVCNSLPSKIRWLSVQSSCQNHTANAIIESKLHLRSLTMFEEFQKMPKLVDFHALRVLDLKRQWSLENKDIKYIGSLSQLRYLRIVSHRITELPEEIGKLRHLETLDLSCCHAINRMPSTMVRLQKLVNLFVQEKVVLPANEFGSMEALEEVSIIGSCDDPVKFVEELGRLRKLRKLSIYAGSDRGDDGECFLEVLRSSLNELCKYSLVCLSTSGIYGDYLFGDPSCTFPYLRDLRLNSYCKRVPNGIVSLENLVKLDITVDEFDEEGLGILMGMPSLAHLQLGIRKLEGDGERKLTVSSNGFPLLKVFGYTIMPLSCRMRIALAFAPGAMPALRQLHLRLNEMWITGYCDGADDWGLQHLSGLALLRVEIFGATLEQVEVVKGYIEKSLALHPNRPNILFVCRAHSWEILLWKELFYPLQTHLMTRDRWYLLVPAGNF